MQILQNTYQTRFHGGNTGSNPVGDANKSKDFECYRLFPLGRTKRPMATINALSVQVCLLESLASFA